MTLPSETAPEIFGEIDDFYREDEGQTLRRRLALFGSRPLAAPALAFVVALELLLFFVAATMPRAQAAPLFPMTVIGHLLISLSFENARMSRVGHLLLRRTWEIFLIAMDAAYCGLLAFHFVPEGGSGRSIFFFLLILTRILLYASRFIYLIKVPRRWARRFHAEVWQANLAWFENGRRWLIGRKALLLITACGAAAGYPWSGLLLAVILCNAWWIIRSFRFLRTHRLAVSDPRFDAAESDAMVKPLDTLFSVLGINRVSTRLVRPVHRLGLSPNGVTIVAFLLGMIAAGLCAVGGYGFMLAGGLLFYFSNVLDAVDGQLARLTGQSSFFGGWLDEMLDYIQHTVIFLGVTIGLDRIDPANAKRHALLLLALMTTQAIYWYSGYTLVLLGKASRAFFPPPPGPIMKALARRGAVPGFEAAFLACVLPIFLIIDAPQALFVTVIAIRLIESVAHKNWLYHRLCYRSGGEELELQQVPKNFADA
jgi:phosphatidylglycerophosphate synthase